MSTSDDGDEGRDYGPGSFVHLDVASGGVRQLDDTFIHPRRDAPMQVRWVYVHMIEEYARHNGHADLLRERIDGAKGA
jgi:hypothetical protein